MHDFFDKLGAAAKRAAGNVASEVNVAAEKQKLSDAYKDLGKRCYEALKSGQMPDFAAEVAAIDAALARIEALQDRRNVTRVTVEPRAEEERKPEPTASEPDFILVNE